MEDGLDCTNPMEGMSIRDEPLTLKAHPIVIDLQKAADYQVPNLAIKHAQMGAAEEMDMIMDELDEAAGQMPDQPPPSNMA